MLSQFISYIISACVTSLDCDSLIYCDKTPMHYTANLNGCKNDNFSRKKIRFFTSYFCSKHKLWSTLEPLQSLKPPTEVVLTLNRQNLLRGSYEYPQLMFLSKNKKKKTPVHYTANLNGCKNDNLNINFFLLIFVQNINCGIPIQAVLTSTNNLCFRAKIRRKKHTPVNPYFTI